MDEGSIIGTPNISFLGVLKARTTKTDADECLDVNGNLSGMLCVVKCM